MSDKFLSKAVAKYYRSKPTVLRAIKFDGRNYNEVRSFLGYPPEIVENIGIKIYVTMIIRDLSTKELIEVGDYIIKSPEGVCGVSQADFEKSYEEIPDSTAELYWEN